MGLDKKIYVLVIGLFNVVLNLFSYEVKMDFVKKLFKILNEIDENILGELLIINFIFLFWLDQVIDIDKYLSYMFEIVFFGDYKKEFLVLFVCNYEVLYN